MIKHNILLFYRSIFKDKSNFLINLLGLSFGITCLFMSFFYVKDQMSVDKFHVNKDRLYQVIEHDYNGEYNYSYNTPYPLAQTVKEMFPEIEKAELSTSVQEELITYDDIHLKGNLKYASKGFFDVFSFKIVEGNKNSILSDKNNIVVSTDFAKKMFNDINVVGKSIELENIGFFKISGVYELPYDSSNKRIDYKNFDLVIPISNLIDQKPDYKSDWASANFETFFLLKKDVNIDDLKNKLTDVYKFRLNTEEGQNTNLSLAPYVDLYLNDQFENGVQIEGAGTNALKNIVLISFLILLMICFNFVNIYIAKAMGRVKEIGIKKAHGSGRKSLIIQFFTETFMLVLVSVVLSIILSVLLLPIFGSLLGVELSLNFDISLLLYILAITLVILLLAGGYPAFYLSGYNTLSALNGTTKGSFFDTLVRKGIVFFQFFVSILLVVLTVFMYQQIDYMQTKDLGHNKEEIIIIDADGELLAQKELYLSQLEQVSGVISTTSMEGGFYDWNFNDDVKWSNQSLDNKRNFNVREVNVDFFETMGIEMKQGRVFNKSDRPATKAIINETAVEVMNLSQPVGELIEFEGTELEIVGVSDDFHNEPVFYKIKPALILYTEQNDAHTILVKIDPNNPNVLTNIENFTRNFNPSYPFNYDYFDNYFQLDFKFFKSMIKFVTLLTAVSLIIACLGLFGLISFMIEKRKKELGIRKALGASDFGVFKTISGNFIKMMGLAFLIGIPLAYLLVNSILDGFAYKIGLNPLYFVISMILVSIVTLVTLGFHSSKLSRIDPTVCLREE